eukprot:TRINITY_DN1338_c0_g1_i11.p1 TRINITY_DN1338_c0_g1~~TRINITY_DN1338_c0_g1_i11.p1  ORF type:complete len:515 (+),score=206.75 TRINITY_DN1338_c0_g1_i11:85-1629(+)
MIRSALRGCALRAQMGKSSSITGTPEVSPCGLGEMAEGAHKWVNPHLVSAEYAVRGPLLIRSDEIREEMKKDPSRYPFSEIIPCNIGNPQAMLQKPITYYRQVAALLNCPTLLENEVFLKSECIPADVIKRAKVNVAKIGHANMTGAYTESLGYKWIRQNLAAALEKRDGAPANPNNIFLTDGASPGIKVVLNLLISGPKDGIMIPIPQYPLYTATIAMLGGTAVPYYLEEEGGWSLDLKSLKSAYDKSVAEGTAVKAVVIINPGNPTGNVLPLEDLRGVCEFCQERGILLLSDEVYQENIYRPGDKFISAKSVVAKDFPTQPLISFHSVSKGVTGECGKRGGYMEVANIPVLMHDVLVKMASVGLCPNINGQLLVDLMMTPPQEGEESYPLWLEEYTTLLDSLKSRAKLLTQGLNGIRGIHTNEITGAMYAYPSLTLPEGFAKEASSLGREVDVHWCFRLMEATGVVVVPGSGFGQKPGTSHFRITILPPEEKLQKVIAHISKFQDDLFAQYQ